MSAILVLQGSVLRAVKAVAFDLDGTLIDLNGSYQVVQDACRAFSVQIPSIPEIRCLIQVLSLEQIGSHVLGCASESSSQRVSAFVEWIHERYETYVTRFARLVAGTAASLSRLVASGYKLAIVSNNDRSNVMAVVKHFGLEKYFSAIVTKDDVRRLKPDPEMIIGSARNLGLTPHEQLVVGDSKYDTRAATMSGSPSIGVTTGVGTLQEFLAEGALDVVPSVSCVPDVLFLANADSAGQNENLNLMCVGLSRVKYAPRKPVSRRGEHLQWDKPGLMCNRSKLFLNCLSWHMSNQLEIREQSPSPLLNPASPAPSI